MRKPFRPVTYQEIEWALVKTGGSVNKAAKLLCTNWGAVYSRVRDNARLQEIAHVGGPGLLPARVYWPAEHVRKVAQVNEYRFAPKAF